MFARRRTTPANARTLALSRRCPLACALVGGDAAREVFHRAAVVRGGAVCGAGDRCRRYRTLALDLVRQFLRRRFDLRPAPARQPRRRADRALPGGAWLVVPAV